MADPSLVPLRKARTAPTSQTILREQAGHELVFAIVGHIGSGVTHTAEMLKTALEDPSLPGGRFDVTVLKARDQILEWAARTGRPVPTTGPRDIATVTALQDLGDEMRGAGDHAAVARALITKIRNVRATKQGVTELDKKSAVIPDGTRRAFILDSIRHPMEVHLLRTVYRNAFALVGVVCDELKRITRIVKKLDNAGEHKAQELMQRDAKAPQKHGQRVGDAFHLADIFLDNSADRFLDAKGTRENPDWDVADQLARLVEIITHSAIVRPRPEETAMHVAYGTQVRSACLSRQVGASIIDAQGVLVASGTNEVPRAGGGVYGSQLRDGDDEDEDHRCAYRGIEDKPFCANTREQSAIAEELIATLVAKGLVTDANRQAVLDELRRSRIGSLVEFSRAVHAEMDALLSAARSGKSTRGTRMFVTTFPCHYCARHVVAAGVDEVQYIEPYPKSQALKLHDDSIGVDATNWKTPSSGGKQVLFRPFRGVAPRMYARAFLKDRDLKDDVTGVMSIGEPEWGSSFDLTRVGYAEVEALLSHDGAEHG